MTFVKITVTFVKKTVTFVKITVTIFCKNKGDRKGSYIGYIKIEVIYRLYRLYQNVTVLSTKRIVTVFVTKIADI